MPTISKISYEDKPAVYAAFELCFPDYAPVTDSMREFLEESVNWTISYKAEYHKKIVGFYLLGERKLSVTMAAENAVAHEDISKYENL